MDDTIWQILIVLLVVAVAAMALMIVAIARQLGALILRAGPPRPGSIEGGPPIGEAVRIPGLFRFPAVVAFVSPDCGPCEALRPALPAVARHYPELALVVAVVGEDNAERDRLGVELAPHARTDLDELYRAWRIPGTPFAVGVDSEGIARLSGVVNNLDQLEVLAESVLALPSDDASESADGAEAQGREEDGFGNGRGDGRPAFVPVGASAENAAMPSLQGSGELPAAHIRRSIDGGI